MKYLILLIPLILISCFPKALFKNEILPEFEVKLNDKIKSRNNYIFRKGPSYNEVPFYAKPEREMANHRFCLENGYYYHVFSCENLLFVIE